MLILRAVGTFQTILLSYTFGARKPAFSNMSLLWPIWNRFDLAAVAACWPNRLSVGARRGFGASARCERQAFSIP
jgi:hypothetical protein